MGEILIYAFAFFLVSTGVAILSIAATIIKDTFFHE